MGLYFQPSDRRTAPFSPFVGTILRPQRRVERLSVAIHRPSRREATISWFQISNAYKYKISLFKNEINVFMTTSALDHQITFTNLVAGIEYIVLVQACDVFGHSFTQTRSTFRTGRPSYWCVTLGTVQKYYWGGGVKAFQCLSEKSSEERIGKI